MNVNMNSAKLILDNIYYILLTMLYMLYKYEAYDLLSVIH